MPLLWLKSASLWGYLMFRDHTPLVLASVCFMYVYQINTDFEVSYLLWMRLRPPIDHCDCSLPIIFFIIDQPHSCYTTVELSLPCPSYAVHFSSLFAASQEEYFICSLVYPLLMCPLPFFCIVVILNHICLLWNTVQTQIPNSNPCLVTWLLPLTKIIKCDFLLS